MIKAIQVAEERYATLLSSHGEPAIQAFRELSSTFTFQEYTLCRVLQPFLLEESTYAAAMDAAALFFRGLLAILEAPSAAGSSALEARPRRRPLLGRAIARGALLGGRADMLLTGSGFKVLEFNPTTPDYMPFGVECSDPLASQFSGMAIVREFSQEFPGRFISLQERLFESFVSQHARRGGAGVPSFAIINVPPRVESHAVDAPPPNRHFLNLFAYLNGRGIGVQLCGIADLEYDGDVLAANGERIDVVFTVGDPEYLDFCPPDDPLWRAVQDGAVSMACGYPLGSVLDDKGWLADLSDPATNRVLDPALVEGTSKIVPWTRRVTDTRTTFGGASVDLLDFIRSNREMLVLKPTLGMGGHGVCLGWEMSQERWVEALETLASDYIVQERVAGERVRLPTLNDGGMASEELFFDLGPFVWSDGRAEGCLVRVSSTPILNIKRGATMAPVWVLDGHPAAP